MKTMKKVLALVLSLVMVAALSACTDTQKTQSEDDVKAAAYNKILEGLKYTDTGLPELTVATSPDFAPMEFVDLSRKGDAQYVGFDMILAIQRGHFGNPYEFVTAKIIKTNIHQKCALE